MILHTMCAHERFFPFSSAKPAIAVSIVLVASQPVAGQELSAANRTLLARVEALHRENQGKIKTWEGDALVSGREAKVRRSTTCFVRCSMGAHLAPLE